MSTEVSKIVPAAVASGDRRRQRRGDAEAPADRSVQVSVPIVLISTLALSLGLATPAQAQAQAVPNKSVKTKPILTPAATPIAPVAAVAAAPSSYTVVSGDTVSAIAARFGLSTGTVLARNGLSGAATIFPGQILSLAERAVPKPKAAPAPAPAAAPVARYTVKSGDTIGGIAAAHGLGTAAVLAANGLVRGSVIYPGQSIALSATPAKPAPVKPAVAAAPVTPVTPAASPPAGTHTIKSGETISGVAAAAGVSVQAVLTANRLGWSSMIFPGQVLKMPLSPAAAAAAAAAKAKAQAAKAAAASAAPALAAHVIPILTAEMRQHASTIVAVGRAAGVSDYGLIVALAAAAQESGLRNVTHGDRDSLGLFQQRPSVGWGTKEQVMNTKRASLAFFGGTGNPNRGITRGLLDIPGWQKMTVTQAAQAVQISAYPNHYAKWEASARHWLTELG